jgi:hypothetical protein
MLTTVLWGHVGDDDRGDVGRCTILLPSHTSNDVVRVDVDHGVIVPLSLIDDEASHAATTHKNIVGLRVLC